MPTEPTAAGELSQRQNSRSSLGSGRAHGVQACPLTTAQTGVVVCDRPHVFDYCCLLWATLPHRLPTTAPDAPRNGSDDLSCTHLRLPRCLVRSSQPGGTRELTVCPSLACTLFPYPGAAKERAPAMPSRTTIGRFASQDLCCLCHSFPSLVLLHCGLTVCRGGREVRLDANASPAP
jgi:hypothetical protein